MTHWPNHIVLFDGECNFCNSSVQFIFKRDKKSIFHFAGLQSDAGKKIVSDFNVFEGDLNSIIYIRNGSVYQKSDAVLRIAKKLKGLWFLTILFLIIPKFIRDYIYDKIAIRRHKFLKNKCIVPTEKMKANFLN